MNEELAREIADVSTAALGVSKHARSLPEESLERAAAGSDFQDLLARLRELRQGADEATMSRAAELRAQPSETSGCERLTASPKASRSPSGSRQVRADAPIKTAEDVEPLLRRMAHFAQRAALSPRDSRVLTRLYEEALATNDKEVWAARAWVAAEVDISEKAARLALASLEEQGWLVRRKDGPSYPVANRRWKKRGGKRPNVYTLRQRDPLPHMLNRSLQAPSRPVGGPMQGPLEGPHLPLDH